MTINSDPTKADKIKSAIGVGSGTAKRTTTARRSPFRGDNLNGAQGFVWSIFHPIQSSKFGFEYVVTGMLFASATIGIVYMVWGQPGSVSANWREPLTWGAAVVDKIRNPVSEILELGSDTIGGKTADEVGGYDPDSFDD